MQKLNVIGAGRVGKTLANLFVANRVFVIGDVFDLDEGRVTDAVRFIGDGTAVREIAQLRAADIWLIAVPDPQVAEVATQLARRGASTPGAVAVHCSGALGAAALAPLRARGWSVASAHPVLSFADPASAVFQFEGTPCGLEGDLFARSVWGRAMTAIGARCFDIPAESKRLYHAAAVFASNCLPVLSAVCLELWNEAGIQEDLRDTMLNALMRSSIDNLVALGPREALTGAASPGDAQAVRAQSAALAAWDATASDAYLALSELASRLATCGTVRARENID